MIEKIEHKGVLIYECTLPGERRSDDVVPAHANCIRASRHRWLVVYATRGFRGVDDDLNIAYQIRDGSPDGSVIKEGMLSKSINDWDPLGDGNKYVKQHGHPVAFGVPKGAVIKGKPAPNANLFVVKWRVVARYLNTETGFLDHSKARPDLGDLTQGVEWSQIRLNDQEDDIEIVQPPKLMRQKGYETGEAFCSAQPLTPMNQTFVQAVPFNADCTEWADVNHFLEGRIAALKYRYNPKSRLYEWVETGPLLEDTGHILTEASLVRAKDSWIIAARQGDSGPIAWIHTDDPFKNMPKPTYPSEPRSNAPIAVYMCPDGVIRLFTGDPNISPYRNGRDPLYCWDIDPDKGFAATNRRVVFDSVKSGLLRVESVPRIDMCKLIPHGGGRVQYLVHRVRVKAVNHPYAGLPPITSQDKARCALYYAHVVYTKPYPDTWQFASNKTQF